MSKKKYQHIKKRFFSRNKIILLFLFIYVVLSLLLFDPKLFIGGDNAVYMILAESIVSGKGYKDLHLPHEPPHTQYPFGFPLLLSLPVLIFGSNVIILKFLVLLTSIGAFFFMYRISELLLKEKAVIIMAYYLSLPLFITYNYYILSEVPFLCFSLGAVYFLMKAHSGAEEIFYYISFTFAVYAFFIRTAGISLIIAMMLLLILKKRYKYFTIFCLIFLVVFIPWQIRSGIPGTAGYIDQFFAKDPYQIGLGKVGFLELVARIWHNFILYSLTILPKTLIPILQSRAFAAVPGCIFLLLVIIGFIKRIEKFSIIESYFIFSVIILLCWPEIWSSERFLLPILPVLIIYIFFALSILAKKIGFRYLVEAVIGLLISLVIAAHIQVAPGLIMDNIAYLSGDKYAGYAQGWRNHFEVINWIKVNIPQDKIIMSRKPEFVYLLSKHKSLNYPFSGNYDRAKNTFEQCDYIMLDREWANWFFSVFEKELSNYRVVFQTSVPKFYLLQVAK